jgi:hypothetical protein
VSATERELVALAEPAMASFYDDRTSAVRGFCATLCPAERVDEAMDAAFLDFIARAAAAPPEVDLEDLLRRATREVAASRMDPGAGFAPDAVTAVCRAMPELLAASVNGELPAEYEPLDEHLRECQICRANHGRLASAEAAFGASSSTTEPPAPAAAEPEAAPAAPEASVPAAPEPDRGPRPEFSATPSPIRVRARRGGLVGAIRRLADR